MTFEIDVRAEVNNLVNLNARASKWIFSKAMDREFVKIGQLASHLKVKKDVAIQVVSDMVNIYSDLDRKPIELFIFIDNGQVPQWLRECCGQTYIYKMLSYARTNATSLTYRKTFEKTLFKLPNFKEKLIEVWKNCEAAVVQRLHQVGYIDSNDVTIGYESIVWLNNNFPSIGGKVQPGNGYENGCRFHLDYARVSYEKIESMDFYPFQSVKVIARKSRNTKVALPQEVIGAAVEKANLFIALMAGSGYQLYRTSFSLDGNGDSRTVLVFAGKSGMGETIDVRLPVPNVLMIANR